jgi:hypothetical protein
MSSTSAAYQWSSCKITWKNFVVSLLTPAKKNCASAWANHMAGRSAQNSGSRTVTLDTSAGGELSATSMLRRGHQCEMSIFVNDHYNRYSLLVTGDQGSRAPAGCQAKISSCQLAGCGIAGPEKGACVAVSWLAVESLALKRAFVLQLAGRL